MGTVDCAFLDLKLHDIPNTVRKSMKVLAGMGVDICNLHAAGTTAMMRAALDGLTEGSNGGQRPLLIAVTQLTSTSEEVMRKELLIDHPIGETVRHYAMNAREAGLDGVVCSPHRRFQLHHEHHGKRQTPVVPEPAGAVAPQADSFPRCAA